MTGIATQTHRVFRVLRRHLSDADVISGTLKEAIVSTEVQKCYLLVYGANGLGNISKRTELVISEARLKHSSSCQRPLETTSLGQCSRSDNLSRHLVQNCTNTTALNTICFQNEQLKRLPPPKYQENHGFREHVGTMVFVPVLISLPPGL